MLQPATDRLRTSVYLIPDWAFTRGLWLQLAEDALLPGASIYRLIYEEIFQAFPAVIIPDHTQRFLESHGAGEKHRGQRKTFQD